MIWYGVFLLLVDFTTAQLPQKLHPLSDEYIQQINNKQSTWRAGRNFEIDEYELFKTLASGVKERNVSRVTKKIHYGDDDDIPESFDSREAWPECAEIIGLIRDQSNCGSCWAFAAVEAMSDRICIYSDVTKKMLVSAQDLLTCGNSGSCLGGWVDKAWNHWIDSGIVTGGLYNRIDQGCKAYFLPPCDDHPNNCKDYNETTPDCKTTCDDSSLDYETQKTYGKDFIVLTGEKQMQLEILQNGPVETYMSVYEDFASYKSGIYQVTSDVYVGSHAVKTVGWGLDNNTKFWIIANSWNERWGENGFFRIIRGQDEAGIERYITAALPDFSKF